MNDDKRKLYIAKYQAQLVQWHTELDKLKARAVEASADARLEIDKHTTGLHAKTDELRQKLAELGSASSEAWDDLATGFEGAWSEAQAAWESARARFRS